LQYVWAAILGVVQGLTEFLPISSTAHLKLIPWAFGIEGIYPVLASPEFDIALHAGSFIAIVLALWPDWAELFRGALRSQRPDATDQERFQLRLLGFLLLTSVPGAIVGVLFESQIETFETPSTFHYAPLIIGVAIIFFGVLLWAVDRFVSRGEKMEQMNWWQALLIGLAQAVALVPGVSRSGATITAGRALGIKRDAVAKYSFMAAAPIIGGAAVYGLKHVPLSELVSGVWIVGFVCALLASIVAMRFMLAWVRTRSYGVFAIYRVVVGVLVIVWFFFRG
jgi:undecaprenyl-diphosphatase